MKMSSFNYPPQDDGEPQYASSGSGENHMPDDDDPNWVDAYRYYPPNQGEAQDQPGYAGINEDYQEQKNDIYGKIMLSGILVFIFIILLAILLHVYARWFWRRSARFPNRNRRRSSSIRHRFNFIEEEPVWLRNVGLQSAVLETLPIFVYKSQDFTDGLECAVCLCEFEENEKARLLPNCRHNFHVECIDMWFRAFIGENSFFVNKISFVSVSGFDINSLFFLGFHLNVLIALFLVTVAVGSAIAEVYEIEEWLKSQSRLVDDGGRLVTRGREIRMWQRKENRFNFCPGLSKERGNLCD